MSSFVGYLPCLMGRDVHGKYSNRCTKSWWRLRCWYLWRSARGRYAGSRFNFVCAEIVCNLMFWNGQMWWKIDSVQHDFMFNVVV